MTVGMERILLGGDEGRRDTPLTALPKIARNFDEIQRIAYPDLNDGAGPVALETILRAMGGSTLGVRQFTGSDGSIQLEVGETLLAVNRVRLQGSVTGQGVSISAQGDDTNIGIDYAAKGTGGHAFGNGAGEILTLIDEGQSQPTDNYFSIRAGSLTRAPRLSANYNAEYEVPDTRQHLFTVAGEPCLQVARVGSGSTNYVRIRSSSSFARIEARNLAGSGNISLYAASSGSAGIFFANGAGTIAAIDSNSQSSGIVDYLVLRAAVVGDPVVITASGTSTNVDIAITPKGSGLIRYGTWTSNADAAVNGYITIKDSGGTSRKLATIA